MNILIVEDDRVASTVLAASLQKLGHAVTVSADGADGWRCFRTTPHRLVISDWMMPGLDGLELCRRIRAHDGDYTYFILLSGQTAKEENLDQAITARVDDFLQKPVRVEELRMRLHVAERILGYATQLRQLESCIPICGYCKKVRDDKNYWNEIEQYINTRIGSEFSHGCCPACYDRVLVPQMLAVGITPPPFQRAAAVK